MKNTSVEIPTLVRMKAGSLDRLGIYCRRADFQRVVLLISSGLPGTIPERAQAALVGQQIEIVRWCEVGSSTYEHAQAIFQSLPTNTSALIGLDGGKALILSERDYTDDLAGILQTDPRLKGLFI